MANTKNLIRLQFSELNINDILKTVRCSENGRCFLSTFVETPINDCQQENVEKVKYEAHEADAIRELQVICDHMRSKWSVEKIAISHRLGEVLLEEPNVIIAISSFQQKLDVDMQLILNRIKTLSSISKKEILKSEKIDSDTHSLNDSNAGLSNIEVNVKDETFDYVNEQKFRSNDSQKTDDNDSKKANNKIDSMHIQSQCTKEIEKRRIRSLFEYTQKKRNEKNMKKNCIFRQTTDESEDETKVCARVNVLYQNTNIVRRVYNKWSDQNIPMIYSELEPISVSDEKTCKTDIILGINKPVARDIYERIKNMEDRLSILEDIDPKYKYFLRTEKCQKCCDKELENKSKQTSVLDERLSSIEKILGIDKPVPRDVYERLENMESRLLFLEGCSPEYKDFSIIEKCEKCSENQFGVKSNGKRTYSSSDESRYIEDMQKR